MQEIPSSDNTEFRRSSRCSGGGCVEVAHKSAGILVRDSKAGDDIQLSFTLEEWNSFVAGVREGEFDFR